MRTMKLLITILMVVAVMACSRTNAPSNLQEKLDSIKALEQVELLQVRGIRLDDENPLAQLYDSMAIQALPLTFSEDYVAALPNYSAIPLSIAHLMGFEGRTNPKAIALPETVSTRMIILAADESDDLCSLWLYTIGADYLPVDRICLYTPKPQMSEKGKLLRTEFSITSDYEVFLTTYDESHKMHRQRGFFVDDTLHFKSMESE